MPPTPKVAVDTAAAAASGELGGYPDYDGNSDVDAPGYGKIAKLRDELMNPYSRGPI